MMTRLNEEESCQNSKILKSKVKGQEMISRRTSTLKIFTVVTSTWTTHLIWGNVGSKSELTVE